MTEPTATPIRVLLVDDDPLVRAGMQMLLGGAPDIRIVGEAKDGLEAVEVTDRLVPDLVLMDIRMPRLDGVEAARRILARHADVVQVLMLTTFDADELVLASLRAGAGGFLLKDTPAGQFVEAVRTVASGRPMLSPEVTATLIAQVSGDPDTASRRDTARARLQALSPREVEVARAVGEGLSNAEISRRMYLSVPTVKAHVSRLLEKLDCTNRVQVAILVHDARL